jgi:hypothetical protein
MLVLSNYVLAGHRDFRTSWLKFTALQECKSSPFHVVLSYCAKQNGVDRNVFFISLNDCKDWYFETHDISCYVFTYLFIIYLNRDGAVDTGTMLCARGSGVRLPAAEKIPLFSKTSRPALNFTQTRIQREPRFFTRDEVAGVWSWPLHLQLVPNLRISGAILLNPYTPSWLGPG